MDVVSLLNLPPPLAPVSAPRAETKPPSGKSDGAPSAAPSRAPDGTPTFSPADPASGPPAEKAAESVPVAPLTFSVNPLVIAEATQALEAAPTVAAAAMTVQPPMPATPATPATPAVPATHATPAAPAIGATAPVVQAITGTVQTSTDPDAATPEPGEDLSAFLRPATRSAAPLAAAAQPQSDDAPAPQENALAALLKSAQQPQQNAVRVVPDMPAAAAQVLQDTPNLDAPAPAKAPDVPITLAAAFGTDPGATAHIKTATAAYEVARAAMPVLPASEQVALTIQRAIQDGIERMTVELKPAALGRVSAEIEFHDDHRVHVVLSAERPATLDALRSDARALERALQDAGLRADAGSLSFRFQNGGGNNGFIPDGARAAFAASSNSQLNDDTTALAAQRLALLRPGGVDIRV